MTCSKPKIIVTGFKPFHHHTVNSSGEVIRVLQEENSMPGREFHILEVTYQAAETFSRSMHFDDTAGGAVLMLGLRNGSDYIQPERVALNLEDSEITDEAGVRRTESRIIPGGPDGLFSSMHPRILVRQLEQGGFRARVSNSAGTFICNSLFYRILFRFRNTRTAATFVHLPAVNDY